MAWLGLWLGGVPPYSAWICVTRRLFNCNNFATSAALAEVCALLRAILVAFQMLLRERNVIVHCVECIIVEEWTVCRDCSFVMFTVSSVHLAVRKYHLRSHLTETNQQWFYEYSLLFTTAEWKRSLSFVCRCSDYAPTPGGIKRWCASDNVRLSRTVHWA